MSKGRTVSADLSFEAGSPPGAFHQLYSCHQFHPLRQRPDPADDPVETPMIQSQLHHRVHRQIRGDTLGDAGLCNDNAAGMRIPAASRLLVVKAAPT